jgi:hypothetical protein
LQKFRLPERTHWTRENWIRAGLVLLDEFVKAEDSNSTVCSLLQSISEALSSAEFNIDFNLREPAVPLSRGDEEKHRDDEENDEQKERDDEDDCTESASVEDSIQAPSQKRQRRR